MMMITLFPEGRGIIWGAPRRAAARASAPPRPSLNKKGAKRLVPLGLIISSSSSSSSSRSRSRSSGSIVVFIIIRPAPTVVE